MCVITFSNADLLNNESKNEMHDIKFKIEVNIFNSSQVNNIDILFSINKYNF